MEDQQNYYGFDDEMFQGNFEKLEKYKFGNGIHKIRFLPPYKPKTLYCKVDLHWGYTDATGQSYPVKCIGENICPLCIEHKRMKGQADEAMAHSGNDPEKRDAAMELQKAAGNIRRKPTYIYQILDFNGNHKQINFTYKQHMAVYGNITFFWKEKKINVTDPAKNMIIYIDRQGKGNQTTYQIQILEDTIKKIDVPKLVILHEIHKDQSLESMQEIVKTGFLPTNGKKKDGEQAEMQNNHQDQAEPMQEQPAHLNEAPPPSEEYEAGGVDFEKRTKDNQVGTPSQSTTEGVADKSTPSQDDKSATSSSSTKQEKVEMSDQEKQSVQNTVNSFCADDVNF